MTYKNDISNYLAAKMIYNVKFLNSVPILAEGHFQNLANGEVISFAI